MNHVKLLACTLMVLVGSPQLLPASTKTHDQIALLSDLTERIVQDFSAGEMKDLVVECSEGTELPFKITCKGQFLSLETEQSSPLFLKIMKTCYIRCDGKDNFLFSTDLQTWKHFSEFFSGELKVSVEVENGMLNAGLQLELNQNQN